MAKTATKTQQTETTQAAEPQVESANPIATDGYDIEALYKEHKTHSAVMRFLGNKKYKTGDIAKFLGKRYQHVRNVLNQPLKGQTAPAQQASTETKE